MDHLLQSLLEQVSDLHGVPVGAYNIRNNGKSEGRNSTANIQITPKTDKSGIDIVVNENTKNESVHIPAISQKQVSKMWYTMIFISMITLMF